VRVIIFLIALGLLGASQGLLAAAFEFPEFGGVIFFSGILVFCLALAIPFHMMRRL
jgi:ABC-type xylose transport system permease subunit